MSVYRTGNKLGKIKLINNFYSEFILKLYRDKII